MRRQTELGSAGSGRTARLDPLALPVRFTASDAVADESVRHVELHRERVILRRAVQGMRIALNVPVQAFLGVSIRLTPEQNGAPAGVGVFLEHRDPALSIELYSAHNSDDVVAEWQLWSRVLGVPCLVAGSDGVLASPFPMLGAVRFKAASLYPLLYRLEQRGWILGRWVEKAGQRRRRHYRVTVEGQKRLDVQRRTWSEFVAGVHRILEPDHA